MFNNKFQFVFMQDQRHFWEESGRGQFAFSYLFYKSSI